MEIIKFYISLQEAENLIFNKCLVLLNDRINIKRAQGLLSINFTISKTNLLNFNENFVILFSSVISFECPEKDQNLFINHYRLPLGLLELSSRNIRDTDKKESLINEIEAEYNSKKYSQLRNGFIGVYEMGYKNISNLDYINSSKFVLNEFLALSDFRKKLLVDLFEDSKFPTLIVNVDRFVTDNFYRVTWWGKFIVDNYVNKLENKTPEEIDYIRKWLRGFLQFDSIDVINQQLINVPEDLKQEIDFLLGYYFSSVYFEYFQSDKDFLEKLSNEIQYSNKNTLLNWITFFKSIFDQDIMYLYFVKSLNKEVFQIEKMAFELSSNNFEKLQSNDFEFDFNEIERNDLIIDFFKLKFGGNNHNPQLINSNEAKNIFINSFSEESLKTNGFELKAEYHRNKNFKNTCWFTGKNFQLNLNSDVNISDIVYYVYENSKAIDILKSLKLKVKPYSKLIDKNKKVLLGFIRLDETPNLISIYSALNTGFYKKQFDKIVFVLLVDIETEKIQSLEFDNYRKEQENDLSRMFGKNIELIIKNVNTESDTEVKRNLKNILNAYKMQQIEVIDENFDEKKALWILGSNTEYLLKNDSEQYYSFFNMD